MDWEDLRNVSTGTSIANAALALGARLKGRKPELRVRVKCTGGGAGGLTFSALVSEIANQVPALDVHVFAEIDGVDDWRFETHPFNLSAGELDRRIPWVRESTRSGSIPHVRLGRYVRYDRGAVLAWLEECSRPGRPVALRRVKA